MATVAATPAEVIPHPSEISDDFRITRRVKSAATQHWKEWGVEAERKRWMEVRRDDLEKTQGLERTATVEQSWREVLREFPLACDATGSPGNGAPPSVDAVLAAARDRRLASGDARSAAQWVLDNWDRFAAGDLTVAREVPSSTALGLAKMCLDDPNRFFSHVKGWLIQDQASLDPVAESIAADMGALEGLLRSFTGQAEYGDGGGI